MTRSHESQDIALENFDQSIPEERAVLIGDTPYEPLNSPQQENAPPFPTEEAASGDLDSQIQELQNQLDQCRLSTVPVLESNHTGGVFQPDDSEVLEEEVRPVNVSNENHLKASPTMEHLEPNGTKPASVSASSCEEPSKGSGSCQRVFALTVLFLMLTMLLLVVLVLETDLAIPGIQNIRQFPSVDSFKHEHYNRIKALMLQKVGGWFKA